MIRCVLGENTGVIIRALKKEKRVLMSPWERALFVDVVLDCVKWNGSLGSSEYQFRLDGKDVEEIIGGFNEKVGKGVMDTKERVCWRRTRG